jgi:RNA polymerase sigma-70 factor (ECF subfamily)
MDTKATPRDGHGETAADRPLESTVVLLERIREGDEAARDRLVARYLPILRSWSHGRLPPHARGLADTDDLVQISLVQALNHLKTFEVRREGAFLAYLRQIALNAVRQEIRRASRRPSGVEADENLPDASRPAIEEAIGRETLECYEAALQELTEDQREAVILRIEFGMSFPEVAEAMGKPSPNAARMLVVRALVHLAERMRDRRD